VRNFFQTLYKSIYSPELYKGIFERSFASSIGYFVTLCLVLALVNTVWISVELLPDVKDFGQNFFQKVESSYPDDLILDIKDSKVTSNKPGATYIADRFIVIDTDNSFTLDKYKEYDAVVWITKDGLATRDGNGKIEIVGFEEFGDMRIDKAYVTSMADKILPFVTIFTYSLPVLVYFVMFLFHALSLVYLFFGALVVWLICGLMKVESGYKKSYQIALHAMTLPLILNALGWAPVIPFFTTILLAVVAWINLRKIS
jgi:hypothetical protein